jgi:hypothetical protein
MVEDVAISMAEDEDERKGTGHQRQYHLPSAWISGQQLASASPAR